MDTPDGPKREGTPAASRSERPNRPARRDGGIGGARLAALIGAVVGLVGLGVVGTLIVIGIVGTESPTEVTEEFFEAAMNDDGEAAQELTCLAFRSEFSRLSLGEAGLTSYEITDEDSGDGGDATVKVTTTTETGGQALRQEWTISLVDEDGYKVCGITPEGRPTVLSDEG